MPPASAEQRTRFFDTYRSYVINYNLGKDLVKQYVESRRRLAAGEAVAGVRRRPAVAFAAACRRGLRVGGRVQ